MEELKSGEEEFDYCKVQNVLLKCLEHLGKSLNIQKHENNLLKMSEIYESYGDALKVVKLVTT